MKKKKKDSAKLKMLISFHNYLIKTITLIRKTYKLLVFVKLNKKIVFSITIRETDKKQENNYYNFISMKKDKQIWECEWMQKLRDDRGNIIKKLCKLEEILLS